MTDLRTIERVSIRAFVQSAADEGYLSGRVLDYGCGKQPYRDIVEAAGGEYEGYDDPSHPGAVAGPSDHRDDPLFWVGRQFDAILCTQVVQYVPTVMWQLGKMRDSLAVWENDSGPVTRPVARPEEGGHLVLTYPTNWPEVEPEDLHRFTKAGMERLLSEAGFEIVRHERRAWVDIESSVVYHGEGADRLSRHSEELALGYGVIARA